MIVIEKKRLSIETEDGAGVRLRRLFPTPDISNYDPFLLFDEFFLQHPAGFPFHPHHGFEAVTYMLEGGFRHRDSMHNETTVMFGGVQRITTGKGIEHSEMPGTEGMNHGIQLWIDLPREMKDMEPDYQQVEPYDIPIEETTDAVIRTIIGDKSPVFVHAKVTYRDIILKTKHVFDSTVPRHNRGMVYVLGGVVRMENQELQPGEAYFFGEERTMELYAQERSRFLFLTGKPFNERTTFGGENAAGVHRT